MSYDASWTAFTVFGIAGMCISLGLLDDMSRGMQEACYNKQRYDIKG